MKPFCFPKKRTPQPRRRLFAGVLGLGVGFSTMALAFEPGQRWACVTDQGENAFLAVHDVQGSAISFSWGVMRHDQTLSSLCNKRDRLSVKEMSEFCTLLGDEFSNGHVKLTEVCGGSTNQ